MIKTRKISYLLIILSLFLSQDSLNAQKFFLEHPQINPFSYKIEKSAVFKKAAVSSAHPLASLVGSAIMQDGGNAYDAAIAVQFVLAVVYPQAGNLGGGGFLLTYQKNGKIWGLDYRESAPKLATKNMYLNADGNLIENISRDGPLAVGVPGTVAGIFETLKYAKLPLEKLILPAIELAEFGFAITQHEAENLNEVLPEMETNSASKHFSFNKKKIWQASDTLIQTDLAETLKRILKQGKKGFYEGETAQYIVNEMNQSPLHKGIISYQDLKEYHAIYRTPLQFDYNGFKVVSFAPPSSGGIILNQICNMITGYNLKSMGFLSPAYIQLIVEAERLAFADRATYLGDPDFFKVPVKTLTSTDYCKERFKDFMPNKAGNSDSVGAGIIKESEETTHFSIVDDEGNFIAVTTTLNGSYGSKTVVGGAGFILNNEMDDFSAKPGVPNMYGAIGGEANKIEPHKRMLSSMTPSLVFKNNKPILTIGTPGGTTIPTSVLQIILDVTAFDKSLTDAINAPRFHHQWKPDIIFLEDGFDETTIKTLEAMGYKTKKRGTIGKTEGILLTPQGFETVADKRGDDSIAGY